MNDFGFNDMVAELLSTNIGKAIQYARRLIKPMKENLEELKKKTAQQAVEYVLDGQVVGLGTGSTVFYVLQALGQKVSEGMRIVGVPTSKQSERIARELKIPLVELNDVEQIDVVIDGADEVDPALDMIKGGGGALTREKLVARAARKRVIVVDESKLVDRLGLAFRLPVEVLPFAWKHTKRHLDRLPCEATIRTRDDKLFETDNENYILDCEFSGIEDAGRLEQEIKLLPGVVESGLFVGIADVLVIGFEDGVEIRERGAF